MSDNRFITFKIQFESLTPAEVEAERKAADEVFQNDIEPDERDQNREIRYLEMPLSAAVPFEKDLNRLVDQYNYQDCRI